MKTLEDLGFVKVKESAKMIEYERKYFDEDEDDDREDTLWFKMINDKVLMIIEDCRYDCAIPVSIEKLEIILAKMKELQKQVPEDITDKLLEDFGFELVEVDENIISYERSKQLTRDDIDIVIEDDEVVVYLADYVFNGGFELSIEETELVLVKMKELREGRF